jgi:hypothetical protein
MAIQQFPLPEAAGIPSGDSANRPASPAIGDTYYDGTVGFLLIWQGTQWIPCSSPAGQPTLTVTDAGSGMAYGTVKASVAFTEDATGGKALGFTATQSSQSVTATSSPIVLTITGNPGSYSFGGSAYNAFGTSPSAVSVSQTLTSVPAAPTIGTATGIDQSISLTFTAGATGGKAITNYQWSTDGTTYTALSPASTSSPVTIPGLTNGTAYTVRLKAVNENGVSTASSASNSATPTVNFYVESLVIAGGGGAGIEQYASAGGGAGGYRSSVTGESSGGGASAESPFLALPSTNYTVTVGAGGGNGSNGSNSVFNTVTSTGGGYGGGVTYNANSGGSGGGCRRLRTAGSGTANQGYAGAVGVTFSGTETESGGGGGAGAAGGAGTGGVTSGAGGVGVSSSITGTAVFRAGGGGGGSWSGEGTGGAGGNGGGGQGGSYSPSVAFTNGTNGTGGGGGGNGDSGFGGGSGGSGVVILRYSALKTITIGAGLTGTTATVGSNKVTTITTGTGNVSWV